MKKLKSIQELNKEQEKRIIIADNAQKKFFEDLKKRGLWQKKEQ